VCTDCAAGRSACNEGALEVDVFPVVRVQLGLCTGEQGIYRATWDILSGRTSHAAGPILRC
jgi:hypothetical protein